MDLRSFFQKHKKMNWKVGSKQRKSAIYKNWFNIVVFACSVTVNKKKELFTGHSGFCMQWHCKQEKKKELFAGTEQEGYCCYFFWWIFDSGPQRLKSLSLFSMELSFALLEALFVFVIASVNFCRVFWSKVDFDEDRFERPSSKISEGESKPAIWKKRYCWKLSMTRKAVLFLKLLLSTKKITL